MGHNCNSAWCGQENQEIEVTNEKIRILYDSFEKKDISFQEFYRRMKRLEDPGTMNEDLGRLMTQRHEVNTINNAIRGT